MEAAGARAQERRAPSKQAFRVASSADTRAVLRSCTLDALTNSPVAGSE